MVKRMNLFTILILIIFMLFASCSKHVYQTGGNITILYPAPPDSARIQFLTRYGSSSDISGSRSKFETFVAGKEDPRTINKPYGITLHQDRIFIVDPAIKGLQVIDLEESTLEYFLPVGRGQLRLPINCHFDEEGNMYVADVERKQVVIFDKNLEYTGDIGGDENFKPTDVFITGDTVLITDPKNNRINVYDRTSRSLIFSFPDNTEVGNEDWLYNPMNLYVAGGNIYVTDFGNSRVKIFTMKGEYLRSVGSYGRGLGQFVRPKGIAVDRDLNLYVVDAGFQNVQIFNEAGQLLMFLGGPYKGPGDMYLPANVTISYEHFHYYEKYVDPEYKLEYLIFVTNQYGPDKVNVYGRVEAK
ncbi:MAG: 6-bladed beta-propeller [Bacteroidota bacterium]